jgi:hypothetical protein
MPYMARWLNLGRTYISIKNHSFGSPLIGLYKASHSTSACHKISKPVWLYNEKILQFKCGVKAGQPFTLGSNGKQSKLYHTSSSRRYSTYPGSFIRRREILILILAGKDLFIYQYCSE